MSLFSLQFETGSYFLKSIKNLGSISAVSTAAGNQAYKKFCTLEQIRQVNI